jgi:carbamoyltransferase
VLADHAAEWFDLDHPSPYMLLVAQVAASHRVSGGDASDPGDDVFARLAVVRSDVPAVTHVDGSARVQTVDADRAPAFHRILAAFHERTGCPVLINTSFNVRGEPIVCTPEEAYRCFMTTDMDWLVLEDCLLSRHDQPPWTGPEAALELD